MTLKIFARESLTTTSKQVLDALACINNNRTHRFYINENENVEKIMTYFGAIYFEIKNSKVSEISFGRPACLVAC